MNTVIDLSDARTQRAIVLAADAGQWLKVRTHDGRKAYGIKASKGDTYYFTTRTSCTCFDSRRHDCKHMRAVQVHVALVTSQAPRLISDRRPKVSDSVGRLQRGVIPAAQIERED